MTSRRSSRSNRRYIATAVLALTFWLPGCTEGGVSLSSDASGAGDNNEGARAKDLCLEAGRDAVPETFDELVDSYPTTVRNFRAWEEAYFERRGVSPGERLLIDQPPESFAALCVLEGTTEGGQPAVIPKAPPPPPDGSPPELFDRAIVVVTEHGQGQLWAAGPQSRLQLEEGPPRPRDP